MNFINTIMSFYEESNINSKDKYIDCFKLPIEYLDSSCIQVLNKNIINDLELVKIKPPLNANNNNCEKDTMKIMKNTIYIIMFLILKMYLKKTLLIDGLNIIQIMKNFY